MHHRAPGASSGSSVTFDDCRRKRPKSPSHDREPGFDAPEKPVGLDLRHVRLPVSPPVAMRSRHSDVREMLCQLTIACLGEREICASRNARALDPVNDDRVARDSELLRDGPAPWAPMSPSTAPGRHVLVRGVAHSTRPTPEGKPRPRHRPPAKEVSASDGLTRSELELHEEALALAPYGEAVSRQIPKRTNQMSEDTRTVASAQPRILGQPDPRRDPASVGSVLGGSNAPKRAPSTESRP